MKDQRKIKMEGQRHGRLLIGNYLGHGKYYCICDCGSEKVLRGGDIRSGRTKSCGCLLKEHELDIVGMKFHMLTVIERVGLSKDKRYLFRCKCDCGVEKVIEGRYLKKNDIKSCGNHTKEKVSQANKTHGMSRTRIYNIYRNMIQRCENENDSNYENYGGRGIYICDYWRGEHGFENFHEWSLSNGYNSKLSIDRINNNEGYSPDNCRWVTMREQANNRRVSLLYTYNNKTQALTEWCEELGLLYDSVWKRINKYDYSFEKAVTYRTNRIKINKLREGNG